MSVGQQRDACALTKRTVVPGEYRKPQCTCPFNAAHKPTNQTRGVNIPKHQSVSASCLTTIKHMGGSLLASHGIISYVRGTFTSKCSLPCVPHLFKQVLMLIPLGTFGLPPSGRTLGRYPFHHKGRAKAYVQCGLRKFPHEGFRWCCSGSRNHLIPSPFSGCGPIAAQLDPWFRILLWPDCTLSGGA